MSPELRVCQSNCMCFAEVFKCCWGAALAPIQHPFFHHPDGPGSTVIVVCLHLVWPCLVCPLTFALIKWTSCLTSVGKPCPKGSTKSIVLVLAFVYMFLKCSLSPINMEGHGPSVLQLSTRTFVKSACAGNGVCEASWSNTFRVLLLQTMFAEPMAAWCIANLYFVCSNSVRQLLIWCALSQSLPSRLNKYGVVSCCIFVLVFLSLFREVLTYYFCLRHIVYYLQAQY